MIKKTVDYSILDKYSRPNEMAEVFDDDGIIIVDFGTSIITAAHIVYAVKKHRIINSKYKMPVIVIGEIASDIQGEITEIGKTEWVSGVTSALAIITKIKITEILANIFMKFQKNPYPTKLFSNEKDAKIWLESYKNTPNLQK